MQLPVQVLGIRRAPALAIGIRISNDGISYSGVVENRSSKQVWIVADGKKHCLRGGQSSVDVGIDDADGLLLDGRRYLFDSLRSDLGGGRVHDTGAIKVCGSGTLTVHDADTVNPEFIVRMSVDGFAPCNPLSEWGGYKDATFCQSHTGWEYATAEVGRNC